MCLSPPCQDELEAHSAPPRPRLVSCFPCEGNLGKGGGKAPGGPGAVEGLGQQRQNTLPHTCPKGRCHPGAAPAPAEQEPPAQGHSPPDGFTPGELQSGEPGDTSEGRRAWEVAQAEDPKSRHCPSQVDFPPL